jgi:hypothetical protein
MFWTKPQKPAAAANNLAAENRLKTKAPARSFHNDPFRAAPFIFGGIEVLIESFFKNSLQVFAKVCIIKSVNPTLVHQRWCARQIEFLLTAFWIVREQADF